MVSSRRTYLMLHRRDSQDETRWNQPSFWIDYWYAYAVGIDTGDHQANSRTNALRVRIVDTIQIRKFLLQLSGLTNCMAPFVRGNHGNVKKVRNAIQ
jgi:hypothetical protein